MEAGMKRLFLALALALCSGAALAAINLNTATKDELVALPGIGPAKAQAILDYRSAHGPFKSVEEVKDVKGIGAKRFEKIKSELTVAGAPAQAAARPADKATAPAAKEALPPQRAAKGEVTTVAKRDAATSGKP
jgi:competence protein ComEA